ncbi:hypothetical protein TeGR_g1875, partial [Tetraparma gracilis]
MFDALASSFSSLLQDALPSSSTAKLTPSNIAPAIAEIKAALDSSDVADEVSSKLLRDVEAAAIGSPLVDGVGPDKLFVKVFYDELVKVLGGDPGNPDDQSLPPAPVARRGGGEPTVILLVGLQGGGKTTFAAKLAKYLQAGEVDVAESLKLPADERAKTLTTALPKTNRKVLLAACDVYRPAAAEQLEIVAARCGVPVYRGAEDGSEDGDPAKIALGAIRRAKEIGADTVVVDTAGRQETNEGLMEEIRAVKRAVRPDEVLLVVDAMTGQTAATVTASFNAAVGLTGACLTKTDSDAKGGAALSILGVSGAPVKFLGTGEGVDDLAPFFPARAARQILGMGDVVTLVEKASERVSEKDAQRTVDKMK